MSELQRLQTTDWERRSLAETADATAHIYPDTARVIRELLSDYDVLRSQTATLTAERDALRAENERLRAQSADTARRNIALLAALRQHREASERVVVAWDASASYPDSDMETNDAIEALRAFLAATEPFGEEATR